MRLPGKRLHEIFEVRVREAPERIAVCALDLQMTYSELNARADRLAHKLRRMGVGPDVLVALCVDRSIDMVVGMLGILKAGGAYVPIDPNYPAKRINFLLDDSAVSVVAAVSRVANSLEECRVEIVWTDGEERGSVPVAAAPVSSKGTEEDLAYVIYTSGSTGTPKGVMVEHHSVVRLFEQTHPWFQFDHHDVWTLFHSISFDFSVWEIWGALLYGGRLVIVPNDITRSPGQFCSLLSKQGVTVLNQTPTAFRHLLPFLVALENPSDLSLRLLIFGGERLEVKLLEPWMARFGDQRPALVNMYGITETTVHVTYRRILSGDLKCPEVSPIGVPIPDLTIHLSDAAGQEVPDGTEGDLYVAGPGLARGYLNRPDLTAERFIRRVVGGGTDVVRLYHSGDRAVRTFDGELVYLGRSDDQMKVRGFRIEPREIELCLSKYPEVETAIVESLDYGGGDVRLVAYVVPRPGLELTEDFVERLTADLAGKASSELPVHLRPSAYHVISEIPMTPHGKVDRDALLGRAARRLPSVGTASVEITATQRVILQITEDVLQRKGVKLEADLFDLGATSLSFTRILLLINERLGVSLIGSELGDTASVAAMATCADAELENRRLKASA